MSADNYVVVDHNGETFLCGMGFMSDDKGPQNWVPCKTMEDVEKYIEEQYVIEYGVEFTPAAHRAMFQLEDLETARDQRNMLFKALWDLLYGSKSPIVSPNVVLNQTVDVVGEYKPMTLSELLDMVKQSMQHDKEDIE